MCNKTGIEFGEKNIKENDIKNKTVIEVGSYYINGSLRSLIEAFHPEKYVGVDIVKGTGVDQICAVEQLLDRFGKETFDVLISTELLEHILDWRSAITNFKHILKPNGILLITTRSKGFEYHGYPFDFWRYEIDDMKAIFSDFDIEVLEKDNLTPGVFIKARKPDTFAENDLSNYRLYSIIHGKCSKTITDKDKLFFKIFRPIMPHMFASTIRGVIHNIKKMFIKR